MIAGVGKSNEALSHLSRSYGYLDLEHKISFILLGRPRHPSPKQSHVGRKDPANHMCPKAESFFRRV